MRRHYKSFLFPYHTKRKQKPHFAACENCNEKLKIPFLPPVPLPLWQSSGVSLAATKVTHRCFPSTVNTLSSSHPRFSARRKWWGTTSGNYGNPGQPAASPQAAAPSNVTATIICCWEKYQKAGNKLQKANLACSFIPPPQLSNLEISSKQYELENTLAFNTKLYRSILPPTPFAAFFSPCSTFLTWVSQSLCPSTSPFFFLFSVLFFAHAAVYEQTIFPVLRWKTCFLISLQQRSSLSLSSLLIHLSHL